jgi:hypothetical protein
MVVPAGLRGYGVQDTRCYGRGYRFRYRDRDDYYNWRVAMVALVAVAAFE